MHQETRHPREQRPRNKNPQGFRAFRDARVNLEQLIVQWLRMATACRTMKEPGQATTEERNTNDHTQVQLLQQTEEDTLREQEMSRRRSRSALLLAGPKEYECWPNRIMRTGILKHTVPRKREHRSDSPVLRKSCSCLTRCPRPHAPHDNEYDSEPVDRLTLTEGRKYNTESRCALSEAAHPAAPRRA